MSLVLSRRCAAASAFPSQMPRRTPRRHSWEDRQCLTSDSQLSPRFSSARSAAGSGDVGSTAEGHSGLGRFRPRRKTATTGASCALLELRRGWLRQCRELHPDSTRAKIEAKAAELEVQFVLEKESSGVEKGVRVWKGISARERE
eukprot:2383207-Rhodomonas_salina.1